MSLICAFDVHCADISIPAIQLDINITGVIFSGRYNSRLYHFCQSRHIAMMMRIGFVHSHFVRIDGIRYLPRPVCSHIASTPILFSISITFFGDTRAAISKQSDHNTCGIKPFHDAISKYVYFEILPSCDNVGQAMSSDARALNSAFKTIGRGAGVCPLGLTHNHTLCRIL